MIGSRHLHGFDNVGIVADHFFPNLRGFIFLNYFTVFRNAYHSYEQKHRSQ